MDSDRAHFSMEAGGVPTAKGRFIKIDDITPVRLVDGLDFRPVLAEATMLNVASYEPGASAPRHVHVEEQIVIVIDGEFDFEIDGVVQTMRKGDIAVVPAWVPHGARAGDHGCVEIDVFNPPRATLLEHARTERDRHTT